MDVFPVRRQTQRDKKDNVMLPENVHKEKFIKVLLKDAIQLEDIIPQIEYIVIYKCSLHI
jgi:hypothetical protein